MNKKRNLEKELGITICGGNTPSKIDTEAIKDKVHSFLALHENERKIIPMKQARKSALIAAAVVLVLGISAFAAVKLLSVSTWESHSSAIPKYTSVPEQETVKNDIGYEVVIIEEFSNGYKFDNGSVISNNLKEENGGSVEKFKSVSFRYEKDGDRVIFSQNRHTSETAMTGEVIDTIGGIDIYSTGYTSKMVPPGYKYTDEDKAAMESGELIFSEGSQTVEIHDVKAVSWAEGNMHFNLMQIDGKLTEDELLEMAGEIISK